MTHPWLELVPRLEAIDIGALVDDPDALAAAMAERGELVSALLRSDASLLDPEQRDELKARLAAVHERDQMILSQLIELRDLTRQQMEQAENGRRAMSGYKAMVSDTPPARRYG